MKSDAVPAASLSAAFSPLYAPLPPRRRPYAFKARINHVPISIVRRLAASLAAQIENCVSSHLAALSSFFAPPLARSSSRSKADAMGKAKKTRKFAEVKRILNPKDVK